MVKRQAIGGGKRDSLFASTETPQAPSPPKAKTARKATVAKKGTTKVKKKQPADYDHFEVMGVTVYRDDADRVNAILEQGQSEARSLGRKLPTKSDIVRQLIRRGLDAQEAE